MSKKDTCTIWLVKLLLSSPKTLEEIQSAWRRSSLNSDKEDFPERSFYRYKSKALEMMGAEIECKQENGRYVHYISNLQELEKSLTTHWIINTSTAMEVVSDLKIKKFVTLEKEIGVGLKWMNEVHESFLSGTQVQFLFRQHYQNKWERLTVCPAFLKLFHYRWYLIGAQVADETPEETQKRETLFGTEGTVHQGEKAYIPGYWSLERMDEVICTEVKNDMHKSLFKLLNPEEYLFNSYGIMRQWKPITIRIRAFWPQDAYLRDEPLHHSQKLVLQTEDYAEYEIYCRPTYDLKQALIWHRDKIAVLSPESFRQDMISVLKATLYAYETGLDDQIIDE